jgi:hypothetical protein
MTLCLLWDHVAEEKEISKVALAPTINHVRNELKKEEEKEENEIRVTER